MKEKEPNVSLEIFKKNVSERGWGVFFFLAIVSLLASIAFSPIKDSSCYNIFLSYMLIFTVDCSHLYVQSRENVNVGSYSDFEFSNFGRTWVNDIDIYNPLGKAAGESREFEKVHKNILESGDFHSIDNYITGHVLYYEYYLALRNKIEKYKKQGTGSTLSFVFFNLFYIIPPIFILSDSNVLLSLHPSWRFVLFTLISCAISISLYFISSMLCKPMFQLPKFTITKEEAERMFDHLKDENGLPAFVRKNSNIMYEHSDYLECVSNEMYSRSIVARVLTSFMFWIPSIMMLISLLSTTSFFYTVF